MDPYLRFDRDAWARLRDHTPLTLSEAELEQLRGVDEAVSLEEVERVYLPLSRLLNLRFTASRELLRSTSTFVGSPASALPFVIGLAGSVAVGKSTTARILRALLARWPEHPRVDLVTTDGFLHPNQVLEEREIMHRKGFPESYDVKRLLRFLFDLKAGEGQLKVPVYSHQQYDVLPDTHQEIDRPDILVLEGLNVLQTPRATEMGTDAQVVSDFFDFSIYVHAEEPLIQRWFLGRFNTLRDTAFQRPDSHFHRFATMPQAKAERFAIEVWDTINSVNLRENILPTKARASLILEKGEDHRVHRVALRR